MGKYAIVSNNIKITVLSGEADVSGSLNDWICKIPFTGTYRITYEIANAGASVNAVMQVYGLGVMAGIKLVMVTSTRTPNNAEFLTYTNDVALGKGDTIRFEFAKGNVSSRLQNINLRFDETTTPPVASLSGIVTSGGAP